MNAACMCVDRFELLLPKQWPTQDKPVYIHLAGTGDHVSHWE